MPSARMPGYRSRAPDISRNHLHSNVLAATGRRANGNTNVWHSLHAWRVVIVVIVVWQNDLRRFVWQHNAGRIVVVR